jgi:hypothetical protein
MPVQEKNLYQQPYALGDMCIVPAQALSREGIVRLIQDLETQLNCNVATATDHLTNFFDSCYKDPKAQTIEVTKDIIRDLQHLRGNVVSFTDTILALIEFYSEFDKLNLILLGDCFEMAGSEAFIKFPAQKAQDLRHRQAFFQSIKIVFDTTTSRLGLFCNREPVKSPTATFLGTLSNHLKLNRIITIPNSDLPKTYQTNRSLLKSHLKRKFPNDEIRLLSGPENSVIISLFSKNSS